jgi:hypothetical protein
MSIFMAIFITALVNVLFRGDLQEGPFEGV